MLSLKDNTPTSNFDQIDDQKYHLDEMEHHIKHANFHFVEAIDHLRKFSRHEEELRGLSYEDQ